MRRHYAAFKTAATRKYLVSNKLDTVEKVALGRRRDFCWKDDAVRSAISDRGVPDGHFQSCFRTVLTPKDLFNNIGKFCNVHGRPVNKGLGVLHMSTARWSARNTAARVSTDDRTRFANGALKKGRPQNLGRSLRDLITMLDDLKQRGVKFRSITEAIDTQTPTGRARSTIPEI